MKSLLNKRVAVFRVAFRARKFSGLSKNEPLNHLIGMRLINTGYNHGGLKRFRGGSISTMRKAPFESN